MPNDVFADWSVHPVAPAELPLQILFLPKSLKRPLLSSLGQLSVETFCARNLKASGTERSTPRRLWQSIDSLMGRGHVPLSTSIDAPKLHRYFDEKIAGVSK